MKDQVARVLYLFEQRGVGNLMLGRGAIALAVDRVGVAVQCIAVLGSSTIQTLLAFFWSIALSSPSIASVVGEGLKATDPGALINDTAGAHVT